MNILKGIQGYGKMIMSVTIIVSIIMLIITTIGLIYINFFFQQGYVSKSVTIDSEPMCLPPTITDDDNIPSIMTVSFYYNKKEYKIPVKVYDNCYIYTKGSKVDVTFNPSDIRGTISIKGYDFKWTANLVLILIGLAAILLFIYDYYFIENKTAQTIAGGEGIATAIKNLF